MAPTTSSAFTIDHSISCRVGLLENHSTRCMRPPETEAKLLLQPVKAAAVFNALQPCPVHVDSAMTPHSSKRHLMSTDAASEPLLRTVLQRWVLDLNAIYPGVQVQEQKRFLPCLLLRNFYQRLILSFLDLPSNPCAVRRLRTTYEHAKRTLLSEPCPLRFELPSKSTISLKASTSILPHPCPLQGAVQDLFPGTLEFVKKVFRDSKIDKALNVLVSPISSSSCLIVPTAGLEQSLYCQTANFLKIKGKSQYISRLRKKGTKEG